MAEFTDTKNRRWQITLTVGDVRRVKAATGVDLLALFDEQDSPLLRLQDDLQLLLDVLFEATRPAREAKGVSDDDFADSLDADAAESAVNCLMLALVDFFPSARRDALRAAMKAADRAMTAAGKAAVTQIEALDVDAIVADAVSGKR
jgi:hypothetical protein